MPPPESGGRSSAQQPPAGRPTRRPEPVESAVPWKAPSRGNRGARGGRITGARSGRSDSPRTWKTLTRFPLFPPAHPEAGHAIPGSQNGRSFQSLRPTHFPDPRHPAPLLPLRGEGRLLGRPDGGARPLRRSPAPPPARDRGSPRPPVAGTHPGRQRTGPATNRAGSELGRQGTRICHRIRQQLWRYFPPLLAVPGLGNQLVHPWFMALWENAPTPAQGLQRPLRTRCNLLKKHRIRRLTANTLKQLLQDPRALYRPPRRRSRDPGAHHPVRPSPKHQPASGPGAARRP